MSSIIGVGSAFKQVSPELRGPQIEDELPRDIIRYRVEIIPTLKACNLMLHDSAKDIPTSVIFNSIRGSSNINENIYFYYDHKEKSYVYLGSQYRCEEEKLTLSNIVPQEGDKIIKIKEKKSYKGSQENDDSATLGKRRSTERKISDVIEKVQQWRKAKRKDPNKNKVTLEMASKEIGIPKKSLDDYYQLIKKGDIYGYPFEENKDKQIGHLRQFVKKQGA